MIATMEYVEMLDRTDKVTQVIMESESMRNYKSANESLRLDEEAQHLITAFKNIKDQYDDVQRFGTYHPDYREIMKSVRSSKRKMDMNEKVASFKVAERELQRLLDDVSDIIAKSVSEHIMVPKDGLALTDGGCATGGCGTGGGCGCQAS